MLQYSIVRVARHQPEQQEAELLQGTLDLLILKVLALEPLHGYGIVQRLKQITHHSLQIRQGSLYPALYRLEQHGFLKATWKSVAGRDAKFYALTKAGERRLETERAGWERLSAAVRLVLETAK
jgi:PadR family transcriptional regulator, regulatory protein PadR